MTTTTMRVPYVPQGSLLPRPHVMEAIRADWERALSHGLFTLGPEVNRLEAYLAQLCGVKHAIGVNSGTDALFLAYRALGIGPGKTVVTVPNTFVATASAALQTGATVQFVDIRRDTWLMDWDATREAMDADLFVPVHWAGDMADVPFTPWGKPVVEDACQAIGATRNGQPAGSFGVASALSFHPKKNINGTGDGGAVLTDDDGIAEEIRLLRNHGLADRDTVVRVGYNSRLDTMQAIVLYHALRDLEWVTARRRAHAALYDAGLRGLEGITLPVRDPAVRHVYHIYQVLTPDTETRAALIAHLKAHGVDALIHYPIPLHLQPAYAHLGYRRGDFPVAENWCDRVLSLPVDQYLTEEQIAYVIDCIHAFFRARHAA